MEQTNRRSVSDKLSKYCYLKDLKDSNNFIEVTEWKNGEGWDITINDKMFSLTDGELRAINYLTMTLDLYD